MLVCYRIVCYHMESFKLPELLVGASEAAELTKIVNDIWLCK